MTKRLLLLIIFAIAAYQGWQKFFPKNAVEP